MAAPCFIAWNADVSALARPSDNYSYVGNFGTVKTILQVKPGGNKIRIIEWGYGFDLLLHPLSGVELVETGTVFATVSTIGSGILRYNDVTGPAESGRRWHFSNGLQCYSRGKHYSFPPIGLHV